MIACTEPRREFTLSSKRRSTFSPPFRLFPSPHPIPLPPRLTEIYFSCFSLTAHCPLPAAHYCFKSFSCNTYEPPRKCCKQKTYGLVKPFRCNTYKKRGGTSFKPNTFSLSWPPFACPCLPSSVRSSKFRIPQPLCLPLLRKLPGVYQQFPFWNSTCVLANPFPYPLSSFNSPPGGILWVAL